MIYKLVCAGEDHFKELYTKDNNEVIIAIDGGYKVLKENNMNIDYYFGDHDSLKNEIVECKNKFNYSSIKDDSDFDLAIKYLIEEIKITKDDQVYVYNATGGRLDHFYAIMNTLIKYQDYRIYIYDRLNRIFMSSYDMQIGIGNYKYISFFSIDDDTVITLMGMKYNIFDYNLKQRTNLCLSNEIKSCCSLQTNKKVIVFQSN